MELIPPPVTIVTKKAQQSGVGMTWRIRSVGRSIPNAGLASLRNGTRPILVQPQLAVDDAPTGTPERGISERDIGFSVRTLIFLEGDLVNWIYQVTDGAVMLFKLLPDGRRQVVELLEPGDVFGFSSVPIHNCSAETLAATRCTAFDRASVERSPTLMRRLSPHLYTQLCAQHDHAMLLGRKSAMERMTTFLMRWAPGRGGYNCPGPADGNDHAEFRLAMSRQEIADYLGLTIETVSRTLTKLRLRGVISLSKADEICIHDICRLCRMTGTQLTRGPWCSSRESALISDPWR
jgi:CRP-like cAMP-binding protein